MNLEASAAMFGLMCLLSNHNYYYDYYELKYIVIKNSIAAISGNLHDDGDDDGDVVSSRPIIIPLCNNTFVGHALIVLTMANLLGDN